MGYSITIASAEYSPAMAMAQVILLLFYAALRIRTKLRRLGQTSAKGGVWLGAHNPRMHTVVRPSRVCQAVSAETVFGTSSELFELANVNVNSSIKLRARYRYGLKQIGCLRFRFGGMFTHAPC